MSVYRAAFEAALILFARISGRMRDRGLPRPVLVGGAAAEYYSGSALATGDFDLCTPVQAELEEEMRALGFVKPSGAGISTRGWIHAELGLGFEVVADVPMDGNVDRDHILLVEGLAPGQSFAIISDEDLIADRMGQYASGTARDRLDQARLLYRLNPGIDRVYLDRRIGEESFGDYGIADLEE